MTSRQATLGDRVECKITGFTGIVITHAQQLAGRDRLWVEPPVGSDGKYYDGRWFDIDMLNVIKASVLDAVKYERKAPGGVDLPATR